MCRQYHHPPSASFARRDFIGLPQHQGKFTNVASEHHFSCLLGSDLQRVALTMDATDS
jgi:hypothetical protein